MSKNKDPAVLFYTGDFLAETILWNYEDIGKYIRLLCLQHKQGGITEAELVTVCQGSKVVSEKFIKHGDDRFYNEDMLEWTNRRERYIASRAANGSKGGRPKKPSENHMESTCLSYENHTENGNINRNINNNDLDNYSSFYQPFSSASEGQIEEKIEEIEENGEEVEEIEKMFVAFWEAYPKKKAKADAHARWMKMKPSRALLQIMLTAIEVQKKSQDWTKDGGQYIPYPATWLHRGQWEDEVQGEDEVQRENVSAPKYMPANFDVEADFERRIRRQYSND